MSSSVTSKIIETRVYDGQKPGTSGLRKAVRVFMQEHYTENFVQATLEALGKQLLGSTLVVGGDGRYYGKDAVGKIIRIAAANGVSYPSHYALNSIQFKLYELDRYSFVYFPIPFN